MTFPPELLGPAALTFGLIIAVITAVRGDWVGGKGAREREAKLEAIATSAMTLLNSSQESYKELAAALNERNRLDAEQLAMVRAGLLDELGRPTRPPRRRASP